MRLVPAHGSPHLRVAKNFGFRNGKSGEIHLDEGVVLCCQALAVQELLVSIEIFSYKLVARAPTFAN